MTRFYSAYSVYINSQYVTVTNERIKVSCVVWYTVQVYGIGLAKTGRAFDSRQLHCHHVSCNGYGQVASITKQYNLVLTKKTVMLCD